MDGTGISETGVPSRTAMQTATIRGWHLFVHGRQAVLSDWLGWPFVGGAAEDLLAGLLIAFGAAADPFFTWIAARSRIAEDWLAGSGAAQYVILGAGLDSFAWRHPVGVRVFEVDHPATQVWKRARLDALVLAVPSELVWLPVDFETQSLADQLASGCLSPAPTFVSWLGVVPYLSLEAIAETLRGLPPCSLAVSYVTPERTWEGAGREIGQRIEAMVSEHGEPQRSLFTRDQLASVLIDGGFRVVEDVGPEDVQVRYGLPAVGNERIAVANSDSP